MNEGDDGKEEIVLSSYCFDTEFMHYHKMPSKPFAK